MDGKKQNTNKKEQQQPGKGRGKEAKKKSTGKQLVPNDLSNLKNVPVKNEEVRVIETKLSNETKGTIESVEVNMAEGSKKTSKQIPITTETTQKKSEVDTKPADKDENSIYLEDCKITKVDHHIPGEGDKRTEKTREEIKAEREAKKLAKQAKKKGGEGITGDMKENIKQEVCKEDDDNKNEISKAELKAKRRALQEAQRAAKQVQKKETGSKENKPEVQVKSPAKKEEVLKTQVQTEKPVNKIKESPVKSYQHKLFSHLVLEEKGEKHESQHAHPAIVQLAAKYCSRVVSGSNARCVALLHALKQVITDYITPPQSEFSRGLEAELALTASTLALSRPSGVSMNNALKHIKSHLSQIKNNLSDSEAKRKLCDVIDTYIREQIDVAGLAICNMVQQKISNGDVILTYGCSSLVERALEQGYLSGKQFSVVVVDGGPWYEGREMLRRLTHIGISSTYVLISAVSFLMRKVSKVMLGAHALLANGYVMSRAGTSLVALTASSYNVPVLVCCETHKFCERVQADAFVYNELAESEDKKGVKGSNLTNLSLVYDITPPGLVTAVVTELAILPCTSVPVVLRVKPSDANLV